MIHRLSSALVLASTSMTVFLYRWLPDPMPTHWNLEGTVDGTIPKPWGPFVVPLASFGVWAIYRWGPRGSQVQPFQRAYEVVLSCAVGFLSLAQAAIVLFSLGVPLPMERLGLGGAGLLIAVIGNFLGKVTPNAFFGIRTRWTLLNREVWLRTHRFAARRFVAAGVGLTFAVLLGAGGWPLVMPLVVLALAPMCYSYLSYRALA